MAKNTMDRRIARTRSMLERALMSLILEKGYGAVTVEDICKRANVGRSTFYLHYASKEALKRSGMKRLGGRLEERQKEALARHEERGEEGFGFILPLFEHARDHVNLYRAQVGGRGGEIALGSVREMLCDLVRKEVATSAPGNAADAVPRELVVQYVVGAYIAVLIWWLDCDAELPPHDVASVLRRLTRSGVSA